MTDLEKYNLSIVCNPANIEHVSLLYPEDTIYTSSHVNKDIYYKATKEFIEDCKDYMNLKEYIRNS